MSKKCIMKRLYDAATPYVQLGGYVALMVTLVAFSYQAKQAIAAYEDYYAFKSDTQKAIISIQSDSSYMKDDVKEIKNDVRDIHSFLLKKH